MSAMRGAASGRGPTHPQKRGQQPAGSSRQAAVLAWGGGWRRLARRWTACYLEQQPVVAVVQHGVERTPGVIEMSTPSMLQAGLAIAGGTSPPICGGCRTSAAAYFVDCSDALVGFSDCTDCTGCAGSPGRTDAPSWSRTTLMSSGYVTGLSALSPLRANAASVSRSSERFNLSMGIALL